MLNEMKRKLLIKVCEALALECDQRTGIPVDDEDSMTSMFVLSSSEWSIKDLDECRKMFHEILYAPPPRVS